MSDQLEQSKKPEAEPPRLYERGSWLHERDGDLNPTWLMVCGNFLLGSAVSIVACFTGNTAAIIAALSYLSTSQFVLLISALPIGKAKVLSRASLSVNTPGFSNGEHPFGPNTEPLE